MRETAPGQSKILPSKAWLAIAQAAILLGATGCTRVFYQPSNAMFVSHPETLRDVREEVFFRSPDGTRIAAWWMPARQGKLASGKSRGAVLQFHGNAENMTSHFASLYWLTERGYDLMTFDYRGYGISEGEPSPQGVEQDAQAAIRYAIARASTAGGGEPVVLYGQSLGGAILLHAFDGLTAAEKERVRGLVVESSFFSYRSIARDVLRRSWLTWILQPLASLLVSDATDPEPVIPRLSPTPLLVLHGDHDPIVPLRYGLEIYKLAWEPKRFHLIQGGGHLVAPRAERESAHEAVLSFIENPPALK
jgi:fermentation-respiration switch protein FrsA (DUF1100 family)